MSVAFRRDGDEEHLEPKFAVPIPPGPNWVTPAGLELIAQKVAEFEALLAQAADDEAAKPVKRDLTYWRARQATAEVQPAASGESVQFASRVRFRLNGKERVVEIVGYDQADPAHDRLAFTAPLAQALLGGEVGELLDFNGREEAIEVLEIAAF